VLVGPPGASGGCGPGTGPARARDAR